MGGVGPHHRASPPSSLHVIPASTQHATGKRECQRRAGLRVCMMLRGQTLTFANDRNDYNYIIIYIVMLLSLH